MILPSEFTLPLIVVVTFAIIFISCFGYVMLQIGHLVQYCSLLSAYTIALPIVSLTLVVLWLVLILFCTAAKKVFKKKGKGRSTAVYRKLGEESEGEEATTGLTSGNDDDDERHIHDDIDEQNREVAGKPTLAKVLNWIFGFFIIVLAVFIIAVAVTVHVFKVQSVARTYGPIFLKGVQSPNGVRIEREKNGVIHITADNDHDLFFAQGVAQAQERLWEMDFYRRNGQGRLAEVVGENALSYDQKMRMLNIYKAAQADARTLKNETLTKITAFCDGVNAYIQTNPPLGIEFYLLGYKPEAWTPADVLVWIKLMSYTLAGNANQELLRQDMIMAGIPVTKIDEYLAPPNIPSVMQEEDLQPGQKKTQVNANHGNIFQEAGVLQNSRDTTLLNADKSANRFVYESNNWVIGGQLTKNKKPILAGDTHMSFTAPNIFILVHLKSPNVDTIGAAAAGCPGIVIGHNGIISWTPTSAEADTQDFFILQESEDKTSYRGKNGQFTPYTIRKETFGVMGKKDVVLEVKDSEYGPVYNQIVLQRETRPMALKWTGSIPNDHSAEAFICIIYAKNFAAFKECFRNYYGPVQNYVYADTENNIGYVLSGYVPIRQQEYSGLYPVVADGNHDWQGRVPFEEMPSLLNPPRGWIASANNKAVPADFKYTISNDWQVPSFRINRIQDLIGKFNADSPATLDSIKNIQLDVYSNIFLKNKEIFTTIGGLEGEDKTAEEWRVKMQNWDGAMKRGSSEATLFEEFITNIVSGCNINGTSFWAPDFMFDKVRTGANHELCKTRDNRAGSCTVFAKEMFKQSVRFLTSKYGSSFRWGEGAIHQAVFNHPVLAYSSMGCASNRRLSVAGGTETINVGAPAFPDYVQTFGVTYRQIVDLSDPQASLFIMPMGSSGQFLSELFDMYNKYWASGYYFEMKTKGYTTSSLQTIYRQ